MRPALGRPDTVDERHLQETVNRRVSHHHIPPIARVRRHGCGHEFTSIGRQVAALDQRLFLPVLPVHLDVLADRHRQIARPPTEHAHQIRVDFRQTESPEVGGPGHADVGLTLARHDLRLVHHRHVVLPRLRILLAADRVHCLHHHLLRKDVRQLHAITVLAAHQLLLLLVVVCRGQQFAKDELGNPHAVLGVLQNINALAIILHRDCLVVWRNLNRNVLHGIG